MRIRKCVARGGMWWSRRGMIYRGWGSGGWKSMEERLRSRWGRVKLWWCSRCSFFRRIRNYGFWPLSIHISTYYRRTLSRHLSAAPAIYLLPPLFNRHPPRWTRPGALAKANSSILQPIQQTTQTPINNLRNNHPPLPLSTSHLIPPHHPFNPIHFPSKSPLPSTQLPYSDCLGVFAFIYNR